jgi:nucleoside-diphosphate-sugar epimerase
MKILITGNQGYIGPVVAQHLKLLGHTIVGLDTGFFDSCSSALLVSPDHFVDIQINKDVRDLVKQDFDEIDHVIYLSAISNDPMGVEFEAVTGSINADSAITCAELAKASGVKSFVFASSCSVYGAAGDGQIRDENAPLNPVTAYAKSKIAAENKLKPLACNNFLVTCLRFSTACGFSSRLRLDLVLNDFVASAVLNKEIRILSDGSPWRPLIHVNDMSRAIEWAIIRGQDQPYFIAVNVGDDSWNYQIKDLAQAVAKIIPGTSVSINSQATPDRRSYKVCFDLFKKLAPNHIPRVTLEEAIQDLLGGINSYTVAGNLFTKSNTIRLDKLRELIKSGYLSQDLKWNKK